jgi:hypothetical protein
VRFLRAPFSHRVFSASNPDPLQRGWRHAFAEGGETLHIAEQDRHFAARAFGIGQLGPVYQPGDNARIDIFSERLADLRFDTQLC